MVWRMHIAAVALLGVLVAASWPTIRASNLPGARAGRRLFQTSALPGFLAEVAKLRPNQDLYWDSDSDAWQIRGGTVRLSPPPPATSFGRARITPITAAVGLVIAGFAGGLLIIAMLLWIRHGVGWDFRIKDLILVWLGRRRLMPVVPRDSLPRASGAAAAAAADAEQQQQGGSAGAQHPERGGDGAAAVPPNTATTTTATTTSGVSRSSSSAAMRRPGEEEGRRSAVAAVPAVGGGGMTAESESGTGAERPFSVPSAANASGRA